MKRVAIIGAGASGLSALNYLIRYRDSLILEIFDSNAKIGRKLAATGNGKGNLSNARISSDRYHGDVEGLFDIIRTFDIHELSTDLGLMLRRRDDLYYPYSEQAKTVVLAFERRLQKAGVTPHLETKIVRILPQNGHYQLIDDQNRLYRADIVILACGGLAGKMYGSDGSGLAMLDKMGVAITPLYPSLVQLKTKPAFPALKGCRVRGTFSLEIDHQIIASYKGEGLFTDDGISGIALMQLSRFLYQRPAILHCNFADEIPLSYLQAYYRSHGHEPSLYEGIVPLKLAMLLARKKTTNEKDFCRRLTDFQIQIIGTRGFDSAQVTSGGVDREELDRRLMLKKYQNIYVCGEMLDIDGDCGGFNLHAAFATGQAVASNIVKSL